MYVGEVKLMLEAAETNLKALNKNDITEVKAMKKHPMEVRLVIEAVCILSNVKPDKVCLGNYAITQLRKCYKVIILIF